MGIAYSPPDKVVHADIDASSSHCIRQGLHQVALLAGWAVDEEFENGFVYILTSPQEATLPGLPLQCKVKIEDTGRHAIGMPQTIGPNVIEISFLSMSGTYASPPFVLGYRLPDQAALYHLPPRRLRVHMTPCQIFTYLPGFAGGANAVMGGIPFIDLNALAGTEERCADEDNELKTTQAFWVSGDLSTADYAWRVPSFRNSWHSGSYATLHNNTLVSEAAYYIRDDSKLRMLPVQKPTAFNEQYGNTSYWYPVMMRWMGTEEPLCFDPLIAWNDQHPVKVRGQIWDAFHRTRYAPWETPLTFDDLSWFSYSGGDLQMAGASPHIYQSGDIFTLYLRDPGLTVFECDAPPPEPESGESNYAY